ncbi:MAG TPA: ABC transporter permease, partial [bacterium]|nr:ABC transporter permease [bacterium]
QRSFVVAQIAVAVVLAVGASLMIRTVLRLSDVSLGFDAERLVEGTPSFPHSWREPDKYLPVTREILAQLAQLPEAEHVALRATVPLGAARDPRVIPAGQPSPLAPSLVPGVAQAISPNYFDVVGVRLLRGRPFSGFDREGGSRVAILNEWAARRWWAGEDPVGRMVHVDTGVSPGPGIDLQVVAVAADNRAAQQSLLLAEPGPEVYVPWEQSSSAFPTFVARVRGVPAGALRPVRVTLARLVPDRPVFASSVSANAETQLAGVRTNAVQILGFALVGLFMALLGVHGVLAYAVSRRTRELGVRGALGATSGRLRAMVLIDAFRLAAMGLTIGVPLALGATRLLEGILEGTSRTDPLVYALVILALLGITTLVGLGAARRATRVSAMVALRSE